MKLKRADYKICDTCKGSGYIDHTSYDCWGRPEADSYQCRVCGSFGFILSREVKSKIKQKIGL